MTRLVLVNPNTSRAATEAMVAIAEAASSDALSIEGMTAPFGAQLIADEAALAEAGRAVLSLVPALRRSPAEGVIVSAFADPGIRELRGSLDIPVTGIAEAGMAAAGQGGRRFAVVTTTPGLIRAIARAVDLYGHETNFVGTFLTEGDPAEVMADPDILVSALERACRSAVLDGGAEAIVIGGGPLAEAARTLAAPSGVPVIEPVPAAVHLARRRAIRARSSEPAA